LQVWQLFVALVGGFGLASLQSGSISYVVCLYPLLAACVARYAAHSEMVLDRLKAYLLSVEKTNGYCGYETFNRARSKRHTSGSHKAALRDALLLTQMLATIVMVVRLALDHLLMVAGGVAVIEVLAMVATLHFLSEARASTSSKQTQRKGEVQSV
jgi:elongation factor P--beta-lysine ligase